MDSVSRLAIEVSQPAARWLMLFILAAQGGFLLAVPSMVVAQEVFVTRGASGPVFSDKPQPGAKPVQLPPLSVMDAPTGAGKGATAAAPAALDQGGKPEAAPGYSSFRIIYPEDNGSVAANTALFEVRVAVEPALQLGQGHAIAVSINGRPVGQRFTATEFTIPPEFWGDTLPPANQRQQVDAAIVDRGGVVLTRAAPVSVTMRYVSVLNRPPWPPRPGPTPLPVDKPKPPPAQPFDPWEKKFDQQGLRFYDSQAQPGRGGGR